jgi:hypothetical protein
MHHTYLTTDCPARGHFCAVFTNMLLLLLSLHALIYHAMLLHAQHIVTVTSVLLSVTNLLSEGNTEIRS